jgi:hypothetical protein
MARKPRRSSRAVTRREFDALAEIVRDCCRDIQMQFTRTAQVQAEVDHIKSVSSKLRVLSAKRR